MSKIYSSISGNNSHDFQRFAHKSMGVNPLVMNDYIKAMNKYQTPMDYINPTIIEERQLNVASMDVFSRLMMDRIIFLGDEVDSNMNNIITSQLLYLSSQDAETPISIYLNTPGGSVYDGLAIYDTMQFIPNEVHTICVGMAASMGSILLTAGTKGHRSALPHSRVMIHQPMGGCHGQESDIAIEAREIKKLKNELYEILALHSGQDIKKITKDADRDYWLTAKEAVEYGLIDKVLVKSE